MYRKDVEAFAKYIVYTIEETPVGRKVVDLCVCNDYKVAEDICKMFAWYDKDNQSYYYTGITEPGAFIPGGGWHECWYKNNEGKLVHSSLG